MCGRFTQIFSGGEVHAVMDLSGPAVDLRPRYNIAPSQNAAVVRDDIGGRKLSMLRWGLIPTWAKEPGIGSKAHQRARRNRSREALVPGGVRKAPVHRAGQRILRMAARGHGPPALVRHHEGQGADGLRRPLGALASA